MQSLRLKPIIKHSLFGLLGLFIAAGLSACGPETSDSGTPQGSAAQSVECDPDNGGIVLPAGFCASVVADSVGVPRHLAVNDNGNVYVRLREEHHGGTIAALRDENGNGTADQIEYFAEENGGTGLEIHDGFLYYSTTMSIHRVPLPDGELVPQEESETIVAQLPEQQSHAAKSLALDGQGNLYVNVGAPSNSCQVDDRTPESPGQDPCPLLERHGGIWQFDATATDQTQTDDGNRFATGMRNMVALDWNPMSNNLFGAQHGRDQLAQNWDFSALESAVLPAEEVFRINEGNDFGWPYTYYDQVRKQRVLAPEYGGDGETVGRASEFDDPILAFPGHWAPNDLVFYDGDQLPARYQGGMFIAWHGSWNRGPLPQGGYRITYTPFDSNQPVKLTETFANGFKGAERLESPGSAEYRPTGLAVGPDGSLYISDDQSGRIWRVVYRGTN
jgi:glucose/arabinose dehydrogenase